ncbi:MAG: putative collagen-binding domain-containing protein, partial [Chloroflexota bacterium]
ASRGLDGSYVLIYIPTAEQQVTIHLYGLSGNRLNGWWYDPRTGQSTSIGTIDQVLQQSFISPKTGNDWVLVLDDNQKGFPPPGQE